MAHLNQEELERLLYEHDVDRMECMDHVGYCCPGCDTHNIEGYYEHAAWVIRMKTGPHYLPDPQVMRCACGYIPCPPLGKSYSEYMDRHFKKMRGEVVP